LLSDLAKAKALEAGGTEYGGILEFSRALNSLTVNLSVDKDPAVVIHDINDGTGFIAKYALKMRRGKPFRDPPLPIWSTLLADINDIDYSIPPYEGEVDETDPYLHAWAMPHPQADRAVTDTQINGVVKAENMLLVIRFASSRTLEEQRDDFHLTKLKAILRAVDYKPFFESGGGIKEVAGNVMIAKQVSVLINAFMHRESFNDMSDYPYGSYRGFEVIEELTEYILRDPDAHTARLKKAFSPYMDCWLAASRSGTILSAPRILSVFEGKKMQIRFGRQRFTESMNDQFYLDYLRSKDTFDDLEDLPITRVFMMHHLDAEITDRAVRAAIFIEWVLTFAGFTRTPLDLTLDQAMATQEPLVDKSDVGAFVATNAYRAVEGAIQDNVRGGRSFFVNRNTYKANVLRILTTNSSGPFKATLTGTVRGKPVTVSSKGKKAVFVLKPQLFELPEDEDGELRVNEHGKIDIVRYTMDNPGTLGERVVPKAKAKRVVYVIRADQIAMAIPLNEAISHAVRRGFMRDHTVAMRETGVATVDHLRTLMAQCLGIYARADDFSAFDMHQLFQWYVDRVREGAVKAFNDYGYSFQATLTDSLYTIYDSMIFRHRDKYIELKSLPSGDLNTFMINTLSNLSIWDRFIAHGGYRPAFEGTGQGIRTLSFLAHGDDAIHYFIANPLTPELYSEMNSLRVKSALECNMEINELKSKTRRTAGEFLKVDFTATRLRPNSLTMFGAENDSKSGDIDEVIKSYADTAAKMVDRGCDPYFWRRVVVMVYALRRGIKARLGMNEYIVSPSMTLLFSPLHGMLPFTVTCFSPVIASLYLRSHPELLRVMEEGNYLFSTSLFQEVKDLNRMLVRAKDLRGAVNDEPVERPLEDARAYVQSTQPRGRRAMAASSARVLARSGIKLGNALYNEAPRVFIEDIVSTENESALRSAKNFVAARTLGLAKKIVRKPFTDYSWIATPTLIEEVETEMHAHPLGALHPEVTVLYDRVGVRTATNAAFASTDRLMQVLRRGDPYFPSHLTADSLLGALSNAVQDGVLNYDLGLHILQAMGIETSNAQAALAEHKYVRDLIAARSAIRGVTTAQPILHYMNVEPNDVVMPQTGISTLDEIYREVGFVFSLLHFIRTGRLFRVSLEPTVESLTHYQNRIAKNVFATLAVQAHPVSYQMNVRYDDV
jgi:hypothetical protein